MRPCAAPRPPCNRRGGDVFRDRVQAVQGPLSRPERGGAVHARRPDPHVIDGAGAFSETAWILSLIGGAPTAHGRRHRARFQALAARLTVHELLHRVAARSGAAQCTGTTETVCRNPFRICVRQIGFAYCARPRSRVGTPPSGRVAARKGRPKPRGNSSAGPTRPAPKPPCRGMVPRPSAETLDVLGMPFWHVHEDVRARAFELHRLGAPVRVPKRIRPACGPSSCA